MKHRLAIISFAVALPMMAVVGVYARHDHVLPQLVTAAATRGDVVSTIAATGTIEAVTTVEVGSQVSGTIQSLGADFNAIVRKGQVLARLDPALVQSAIEQARATVLRTAADADGLRVTVADDEAKLARARELSARQLITATDLDDAVVEARSADAQVRSADAATSQARASLKQAEGDLENTVILSPIDGIVVARSVDVGQTVSASVSAPTLFTLAADMTEMQVMAGIDESDVGRLASGQAVSFTVDAYPADTFHGRVEQVRLNPAIESNVVTYTAVVSAPNPQLKLKPGMTANISIEVVRRSSVLRVPASALQFQPSADVMKAFAASAQTPATPEKASRGSTVWQLVAGTLRPIAVTPGTSDGVLTEILDGPLAEGALVVTHASLAGDVASAAKPANSGSAPTGPQPPGR